MNRVAIVLLGLLSLAFSLSCTARYQCNTVSQDYNYVDCIAGECRCLTQQGFVGLATSDSKCACTSGNDLFWSNGLVYCLNVSTATQMQVSAARTDILEEKVRLLYDGLKGNVLPYQYLNASLGLPSPVSLLDIMAPDVIVRVDPFGVFSGIAHAGEYFYVFAVRAAPFVVVNQLDYVYLYGEGDNVFVRVNIGWGPVGTDLVFLNITESGSYRFGTNNTIVSGDIIAHNVGKATAASTADPEAFIVQLCTDLTRNVGSNLTLPQPHGWCPPEYDTDDGGYANYDDCISFMHSIPFGTYDMGAANSVVCRRIHTDISYWDPHGHCLHAGKTGGGNCIDTPYDAYYPPLSPVY